MQVVLIPVTFQALVAFSHHVPGHRANDLGFFDLARDKLGFVAELVVTELMPHIFNSSQQEVFLYRLSRK
jgi:hypothetical protein